MAIKKRTEPPVDIDVDRGNETFVTIIIGNTQIGGSVLKFKDSNQVLEKGEIKNFPLGKGSDLVGRTLKVTTSVLDSNTSTNKMIVTHKFPNCTLDSFEYEDQVDEDGDIFQLIVHYNFK